MSAEWNNQNCMNNLAWKWFLARVAIEQIAFEELERQEP